MEFRNGIANRLVAVVIILLVFVLAGPVAAKPPAEYAPTEVLRGTKQKVLETYGKLPLRFEANQGQADRQVKFLSRGRGSTLFLTSTEAVLTLSKPQGRQTAESRQLVVRLEREENTHTAVLRMKLVGANQHPRVAGLEELPGKVNYFLGNDPKKWRTNIPTYARVEYRDVYPGVNLVYYGNQQQLEYDFIVAPGADPAAIRLAFAGAQRLRTDTQGDLIVKTATGELRMHKPLVYQETGGVREAIPGKYVLKSMRQVGFTVASYDASRPLIIDPVLSYSTYLGGSSSDYGNDIAVDASGNTYVTGFTQSTDYPTQNPFQPANNGGIDAFVTKLDATGSSLVYSTYLGGSSEERGNFGIALDASGKVYVSGYTTSTDFPTTPGAFQPTFGGNHDAFVAKLDPSQSGAASLVYSTYLGGSGQEVNIYYIAVDSSGNAYVSGRTTSTDFPTTPGAFQPTFGGGDSDAFVTKFNAAGSALVYSTYLGGSGFEEAGGLAVDAPGNTYLVGFTASTDFPTTPGAFQPSYGGGSLDAFVTKLNATGSAIVYSTYLGGSSEDTGFRIAVDSFGKAYVSGATLSTNFPTKNPFQPNNGGGRDAFVAKLDPSQSGAASLVYSTYLGGSGSDSGGGIVVDASGNAYLIGNTSSTDFPTTPGAFQPTNHGSIDTFVAKIQSTIQVNFFLHASGSTLFLDTNAPAATTPQFKDSAGIRFSGGNPWKEIGTWTAAPTSSSQTLTGLSDLHVWLGLKNSDDIGTRFDLRAEVLRNGTLVASGETYCITGVTRNPSLAKEVTVSFGSVSNGTLAATDVLSLKVLTRIGTTGGAFCGGHSSAVGLRLYFDATTRPSEFDATFGF